MLFAQQHERQNTYTHKKQHGILLHSLAAILEKAFRLLSSGPDRNSTEMGQGGKGLPSYLPVPITVILLFLAGPHLGRHGKFCLAWWLKHERSAHLL